MRLEAWLALATAGLTPGVQARMRAEYTAHVQDAGLGESGDVEVLLGTPEEARRALGQLYTGNDVFKRLAEPSPRAVQIFVLVGLLGGAIAALIEPTLPRLMGLTALVLTAALLRWRLRRLSPRLRAYLRPHLWLGLINTLLWLRWATGGWSEGGAPLLVTLGLPLLWALCGLLVVGDFQKLRRTLALEKQVTA